MAHLDKKANIFYFHYSSYHCMYLVRYDTNNSEQNSIATSITTFEQIVSMVFLLLLQYRTLAASRLQGSHVIRRQGLIS